VTPDWQCDVVRLFRDENLGCRRAVSGALNWFFEHEAEGIILEDDCLPAESFFPFCDTLLAVHRNDDTIAQISGSNFIGAKPAAGASYFFSTYPDVWGWATWRRSWKHYDVTMSEWPAFRDDKRSRVSMGGWLKHAYWADNFQRTWSGEIDTWDYQWIFSVWKRGGLNIIPASNLIENLGYGQEATHTRHTQPSFVKPAQELGFPLIHPEQKAAKKYTDTRISRIRYGISPTGVIMRLARSLAPLRYLKHRLRGFRLLRAS